MSITGLTAQDNRAIFAPPQPEETALLIPLASPQLQPIVAGVAGLGIAGGVVLSSACLIDLLAKVDLGLYHPSIQNDALGMVAGLAISGIFAAIIDVVIRVKPDNQASKEPLATKP